MNGHTKLIGGSVNTAFHDRATIETARKEARLNREAIAKRVASRKSSAMSDYFMKTFKRAIQHEQE